MQLILPIAGLTLFWAGEVSAQIVLEEPEPTVTLPTGGKFTFQCHMNGGSMSSYYMSWYRKNPDASFTFIYREGNKYGPGLEGHFEGKVEASSNRFTLDLLQAAMSDSGIYYCTADVHCVLPPLSSGSKTK
uniref:Ig-like domain-containing protein n=1 Tax=Ornithorhynchus anatinus TaxID=9258 RepID=F6ZNT4_ORNAN